MVQAELIRNIKDFLTSLATSSGRSGDHLALLQQISDELEKASTAGDENENYTSPASRFSQPPESSPSASTSLPSTPPVLGARLAAAVKEKSAIHHKADEKRDELLCKTLERCSWLERRVQELETSTSAAGGASAPHAHPQPPTLHPTIAQHLDMVSLKRLMALEVELEAAKGRISDLNSQLQDCRLELSRAQARETKQRERAEISENTTGNVREIERNLQSKYAVILGERNRWQSAAQQAANVAERAEGAVRALQGEIVELRAYRAENQGLKTRLAEALEECARLKGLLADASAANAHFRTLSESFANGLAAPHTTTSNYVDTSSGPGTGTPLLDRFIDERAEDAARVLHLRSAMTAVKARQAQIEAAIRQREAESAGVAGSGGAVDPELQGLWAQLQALGGRVRQLGAMMEAGERALTAGPGAGSGSVGISRGAPAGVPATAGAGRGSAAGGAVGKGTLTSTSPGRGRAGSATRLRAGAARA